MFGIYLYESPADILKLRGMPAALIVCSIGLLQRPRWTDC
jgi:hypothetical protein